MYIKQIKINNFKSLKSTNIKLYYPDELTTGSGLNIFIGENNAGKSSVYETLRKITQRLIDKEEITYTAQATRNEVSVEIINNLDDKIAYESHYFSAEDPDNKLYFTEEGFHLDLYHSNTNRRLVKHASYGALGHTVHQSKNEDLENKSDNYQILQEIHLLTPDKKDEFSKIVNDFLPEIKRVFVRVDRRLDRAILACKLLDNTEIDLRDMGSGIEQFIILLWVIKFGSIKVLIIDEPEISLHPKAQIKLTDLLLESSTKRQILIATHSPYIFKNCLPKGCGLFIFKKSNNVTKITDFNKPASNKNFPWSPSWGEINYYAYGLPTIEFHNELYGFIQEKENKYSEAEFERFLISKGISANKTYVQMNRGVAQAPRSITVQTYIRNLIHHPENLANIKFTDKELKNSVKKMISIL